jgi:hypothetical protein
MRAARMRRINDYVRKRSYYFRLFEQPWVDIMYACMHLRQNPMQSSVQAHLRYSCQDYDFNLAHAVPTTECTDFLQFVHQVVFSGAST